MHSVTSEAVASASFPTAPPKPARADQSSGSDSFGALVDSSMPADPNNSNDRAISTTRQQSSSQRRSEDASATAADNARSRDATAADEAARKNSDDRDASAKRLADTDAGGTADADALERSKAKFSAPKAGASGSAEKSSSDQTSAADSATVSAVAAQQSGPAVTTANMVAVVIPVTTAPADIPAVTPAAGNAAAPLAIAAAAIAASSSAASASGALSAPIKTDAGAAVDLGAAADAIVSAAAVPAASDATATAKIAVEAAATAALATPVTQQATQSGAAAVTDVALAAAVAAPAPVAPKTTALKTAAAAPTKTAAADTSAIAPGTPDPSATAIQAEPAHDNVAPQPAVAAKPESRNGAADVAKADTSPALSSTSAAIAAPHEHSPVTVTAHTPTDLSDAGVQATATIQPQPPTGAAAAPVGPLSVTPATNAAVPVGGLALEIAASARSGKSRFEIRLDPADLGRIDVRIDVDRNGQITSHLRVEKPETLSMLRQDAPQLQRQLDDAGFKTGNGGLQFSLRDQSSSGQNNGNETGRDAQRLVISDEDTVPPAVAGRTYGRMLGSSSGLDIRV